MIKFIAHTVREFPTENDFKQFMEYLDQSQQIPTQHMHLLKNKMSTSIITMDGENEDCKSVTTWTIETGPKPE